MSRARKWQFPFLMVPTLVLMTASAAHAQADSRVPSVSSSHSLVANDEDSVLRKLKDVALDRCATARDDHNLSPSECRKLVISRAQSCAPASRRMLLGSAADLGKQRAAKAMYLECITPYYFCQGTEVKDIREAFKHCALQRLRQQ